MKHEKVLWKFILIPGVLIVMILCGIMIRANLNEGGNTGLTSDSPEYGRYLTQEELRLGLREFDKVDDAAVLITVSESSENEIQGVTVHLEMKDEISDLELENITRFVSENLGDFEQDKISVSYIVL